MIFSEHCDGLPEIHWAPEWHNYASWYKDVNVAIAVCEYDLALHQNKPAELADHNGDHTAIEKWERFDRMASIIIKQTISH